MDRTAYNATHWLRCTHSLNSISKIHYHQPCHVLKDMGDGRKKILVFGDRHTGQLHKSRIRYVPAGRLIKRPAHNEGESDA